MPNISKAKAEHVFAAARRTFKSAELITDVAKATKLSRSAITTARLILEFGTEDQIRDASSGKIGIRTMADTVRKTLTVEAKEELRHRNGVWTPSRREELQSESVLWAKLSPAIRQLTELPKAKDMLKVVTRNNSREIVINQHLETASNWLKEFMDEWNEYQRLKSAEGSADPGNGHPAP